MGFNSEPNQSYPWLFINSHFDWPDAKVHSRATPLSLANETAATTNQNPPGIISRVLIGPRNGDIVCSLAAAHLMLSLLPFLPSNWPSAVRGGRNGVQFQALFLIWVNYLFSSGGSYYFLICSPSRLAVGKTINEREIDGEAS